MRFFLKRLGSLVVLLLALGEAIAQGRRPSEGGMLLEQESIQNELKLTHDQVAKVNQLGELMRERFQEAFGLVGEERAKRFELLIREGEKACADILKPAQSKRFKEIAYQLEGPTGFAEPAIAQAVGLSEELRLTIKEMNDETEKRMRQMFQPGTPPADETRKKMKMLWTESTKRITELLSEEQKKKWQELQGEPFKGEIRFRPPR